MPLRLVKLQHPHPLYQVHSGDLTIGRIEGLVGPTKGWRWSLHVSAAADGIAPSKAEAKRQMAIAWRTWLKCAALQEVDGPPPEERVALVLAGRERDPLRVQRVMSPIFRRYQWTLLVHGCEGAFGAALEDWAKGVCACRRLPQETMFEEVRKPMVVITFSPDETLEPLLALARTWGIPVDRADPSIWPKHSPEQMRLPGRSVAD